MLSPRVELRPLRRPMKRMRRNISLLTGLREAPSQKTSIDGPTRTDVGQRGEPAVRVSTCRGSTPSTPTLTSKASRNPVASGGTSCSTRPRGKGSHHQGLFAASLISSACMDILPVKIWTLRIKTRMKRTRKRMKSPERWLRQAERLPQSVRPSCAEDLAEDDMTVDVASAARSPELNLEERHQ